nr:uncharacterized protein I203_00111 [Kwoniella mangroviensis CBS 8507]OCF69983.1 hypothetical protein I203_00111 [Kwoniella mangroviensis CBS 8507]
MSRPTSSSATTRPTHIPLPNNNCTPTGTPLATPPIGSAASPASPRHSFLGFMRTRGRANTLNTSSTPSQPPASPSLDRDRSRNASSREGSTAGMSRENTNTHTAINTGGSVTRSISTPLSGGGLNISTNTNTNGNGNNPDASSNRAQPPSAAGPSTATASTGPTNGSAKTYRIRLVPHLESTRSLAFDPVVRELLPIAVPPGVVPSIAAQSVSAGGPSVNGRPPALLLKIGRFTDKSNNQLPQPGATGTTATNGATIGPNFRGSASAGASAGAHLTIAGGGGDLTSGRVAFKSKVVSRGHAEIWCEEGGKFYIRDTSSSSGTFLNHIRLSSPNTDSRPTMLNDGDILQLGVDYQGGIEEMFRCVKIRVEIGREWQRAANEFNTNALKQLKALGGASDTKEKGTPSKKAKASVTDCCICLFSVTVCQSLFIAPCSHVFHYKCIRPLLLQHHPGFSCPLCRTFANLEEDVETEDAWEIASRRASIISRKPSNHSIRLPNASSQNEPQQSPSGPSGEPSTNIGLGGASSASVNDLLSAEQESEAVGMIGSSALARQTTAVAQQEQQGDVEMEVPEVVHEEESEQEYGNDNEPTRIMAVPNRTLGMNNEMGEPETAQTPMNEHFLSTLAIGDTGIAQRFELADELVITPTTANSAEGTSSNGQSRNGMYT